MVTGNGPARSGAASAGASIRWANVRRRLHDPESDELRPLRIEARLLAPDEGGPSRVESFTVDGVGKAKGPRRSRRPDSRQGSHEKPPHTLRPSHGERERRHRAEAHAARDHRAFDL